MYSAEGVAGKWFFAGGLVFSASKRPMDEDGNENNKTNLNNGMKAS